MNAFVTINDQGQFELDGSRWYCNSVIYFGHHPGAMQNWFTDASWPINAPVLDRDFGRMAELGLNHAALFLTNAMFFEAGKPVQLGYDRMDRVVETAKRHGIRVTLFSGPFIDNADEYFRITGRQWEHDDRWLPSFNPALFDAYVQQMTPLAERYRNEPAVFGYGDRIDRFHKGFDNVTIPHNLKEEWAEHLVRKFGTFPAFLEAMGGPEALENRPQDWSEVLLPQESKFNASLKNPLGYEYILWQKQVIGATQARWDAEMLKLAPHQIMWTPFEGNTNTWAMLDGFSPKTKLLRAIWMEYYYFEVVRAAPVQPFEEWAHTPEVVHRRIAHELPVVYNAAYMMTRYLKQSVQQPVVICHGAMMDQRAYGIENETQHVAIFDRVNAACLAADGDGWHYWSYTDDNQSMSSHLTEQKAHPEHYYHIGESTGLYDWDDQPRPVTALVCQYSAELARRAAADTPPKRSDVLLLSSAPRMYNLFRRLAYPTAAAVSGALARCGVECDYRWTAQDEIEIAPETLDAYRLLVLADNMYERDFRSMPDKLLRFVRDGGTLYFALDDWQAFKDEHGVGFASPALRELSGVDPDGWKDWPGARDACRNWPYPTEASLEPNLDFQAFPRLPWGICPAFRHRAPAAFRNQLLGWRSMDGDTFTSVPGLVEGAEVIAVGKFPAGSRPLLWRHRLGQGWVYVNAWTNNLFRDTESRNDYGGWDYDWMLALALESSGARDVNLIGGAGLWLRNTWGYFWKEM
jgi:hypothetical protein